MRRLWITPVLLLFVATVLGAQQTDEPIDPARVHVAAAGDDQIVWLIRSQQQIKPKSQWFNLFAWQEPGGAAFKRLDIDIVVDRIVRWTAVGSSISVFFEDGVHHRYHKQGRDVELNLPDRAIPQAIGSGDGLLYAIVDSRVGDELPTVREEEMPTTTTTTARNNAEQLTLVAPSSGLIVVGPPETARPFDLVMYDRKAWHLLGPLEPLAPDVLPTHWWLCATPDHVVHIVYETDDVVQHIWYTGDGWSGPQPIPIGAPVDQASLIYVQPSVMFVMSSPHDLRHWRLWQWQENQWQQHGAIDLGEPKTQPARASLPRVDSVTAFGQNILLAGVQTDGVVATGVWQADGKPVRALQATDAFREEAAPLLQPRFVEWLGLLAILAVVMVLLWRRQSMRG